MCCVDMFLWVRWSHVAGTENIFVFIATTHYDSLLIPLQLTVAFSLISMIMAKCFALEPEKVGAFH